MFMLCRRGSSFVDPPSRNPPQADRERSAKPLDSVCLSGLRFCSASALLQVQVQAKTQEKRNLVFWIPTDGHPLGI
jgi:hypothetical protein